MENFRIKWAPWDRRATSWTALPTTFQLSQTTVALCKPLGMGASLQMAINMGYGPFSCTKWIF